MHVKFGTRLTLKHDEDPEPNYTLFRALDKPIEGATNRQYFDIYDLDENLSEVPSVIGDKYTEPCPERQGSYDLKLYWNPLWLKTLQLSQDLMPLENEVYNETRAQMEAVDLNSTTGTIDRFSDDLSIEFNETKFE